LKKRIIIRVDELREEERGNEMVFSSFDSLLHTLGRDSDTVTACSVTQFLPMLLVAIIYIYIFAFHFFLLKYERAYHSRIALHHHSSFSFTFNFHSSHPLTFPFTIRTLYSSFLLLRYLNQFYFSTPPTNTFPFIFLFLPIIFS